MNAPDHEVRLAARALAHHGLVHAYGHVSARLDPRRFVVTPGRPLGHLKLDTPLVACAVEGELPPAALPEVKLHQAIYRVRDEVQAICRFQSPQLMALSTLGRSPRVLHGLGAYFAPSAPFFDNPGLVREPERAARVAATLGQGRSIVLRGNGAVTVGPTVHEALALAYFLEDAARVELTVLATGREPTAYTLEEAAERSADPRLMERMWDFLVGDDLAPAKEHR